MWFGMACRIVYDSSVPLIIDCYNVLHAEKPELLAGLDENALCRALDASPWSRDRITLVCDGKPKPLGFTRSPVDTVEVIYSGPLRTADEVIIHMVDRDSAPRRLLVVSSDRQISTHARRRGARAIGSEAFLKTLAGHLHRKYQQRADYAGKFDDQAVQPDQVDQWLRDFGYDPENHKPPPRGQPDEDAGEETENDELDGIWPPW